MFHRVPLAWRNLTHNRRRLAVAIGGIGFAVILMFMETGFENALIDSTVKVLEELNADIIVASRAEYSLTAGQPFSRRRLSQARVCTGVQSATPLYVESFDADFKPPRGKRHPIRVLAFDLSDDAFLIPEIVDQTAALADRDTALFDVKGKPAYGVDPTRLDARQDGLELSGQSVRVVGGFALGTDFANDGNLVMSAANFARYFPARGGGDPRDAVTLGLVRVEPNEDVQTVRNRLAASLPDDVAVYTKPEFIAREMAFWRRSTPIGYIFAVGTIMGFIVGIVICYQVIYADVAGHLPEFATLKAMGYPHRYFVGVVLRQSLYLSLLGFVPGLLASLVLYAVLANYTGLLLVLTTGRAALVLLLTVAMCGISAALAMRKLWSADPAELF
ncbi:MAG: ABC transporter permease DevC [Pirellulales bacterium]